MSSTPEEAELYAKFIKRKMAYINGTTKMPPQDGETLKHYVDRIERYVLFGGLGKAGFGMQAWELYDVQIDAILNYFEGKS